MKQVLSHAAVAIVSSFVAVAAYSLANGSRDGPGGASAFVTEDRVKAVVASEIADNPAVIVASIERYMRSQQEAQSKAADNQVLSLADRMTDNAAYPVVGNPDGTVDVVYFFDVNCGYCKRLEPVIKKIVEENPDVRIAHREIPILSQTSQIAAFLQAVAWDLHPDRYEALHDAFMGFERTLGEADVESIVKEIFGIEEGIRLLSMSSRIGSDPVADGASARVQENLDLMRTAGISGTPFVFVPGAEGMLRGAGDDAYDTLTAFIEKARNSAD